MHKVFGTKQDLNYYDRPGAYILPIKDGKIAIVDTPKGRFLIGGGIEKGETHLECIKRECMEETGCNVEVLEPLCSAEAYTVHSDYGLFHPTQYYYRANLLDKFTNPIELDHTLLWVPVKEAQETMFNELQRWAIGMCTQSK